MSPPIELAEGAKTSWVTVTRTGTFSDPRYGQFDITPAMLAQMVANFERRVLGQDVFFDVAHKPNEFIEISQLEECLGFMDRLRERMTQEILLA